MPEILLIDDNHDNLVIISELLENNIDDCNVVTARSGAEGIKKAKEVSPGVIFLDIIMPGMDGFQVCRKLKNNSKTADIPIILISAIKTDTESRINGLDAGAYGLIERPIEKNELIATANAMLRISKSINKKSFSGIENELRNSEEKLRIMFESINEGISIVDLNANIQEANPGLLNIHGLNKKEELIGRNALEFLSDEDGEKALSKMMETIEQGTSLLIELAINRDDGKKIDVEVTVSLLKDKNDVPLGFIAAFRDITDKKLSEEAIRASEEKYRTLFETMAQGVVYQNQDGNIISANRAAEKILGLTLNQMQGRTSIDPRWKSIHEDGTEFPSETHPAMIALETGKDVMNTIMGVINPLDDSHKWINIIAIPQFKEDGEKPYQVYTTFEDITKTKLATEEIKNSLKEKEILLSEIHHRVKNNLQVINSLLNLQIKYIRDEYDKGLFKETRDRIYTMSLIHEKLYQTRDLANIEFKSYIKELANQLFNSYQQDINIIEYIIEADDIILGVDLAIPCAQIINELISNSLKYAFPNGEKGMVKIFFSKINNGKHTLIVSDNGIGFPEDIDIKNSDSLGFKIVNALVNQLKGDIKLDRSKGTKLTITF